MEGFSEKDFEAALAQVGMALHTVAHVLAAKRGDFVVRVHDGRFARISRRGALVDLRWIDAHGVHQALTVREDGHAWDQDPRHLNAHLHEEPARRALEADDGACRCGSTDPDRFVGAYPMTCRECGRLYPEQAKHLHARALSKKN